MKLLTNLLNNKSIKIAVIGSLGIKFFSAFFAFLNAIFLARMLGSKGFGVYILAFTTVTLLSIPVTLGLHLLITKYIAKYEIENNQRAIKGLLIKSNQFVIITTLIVYFFAAITYFLWWHKLDSQLIKPICYSFILLPILALGTLRAATLRGLRLVILGQLPDTLLRNGFLFFGILVFYFFNLSLTPKTAIIIHIFAASISFLIGYLFLNFKLLKKLKKIKPEFHTKEWINQTIPFSLNSGIQVIKSKLITYILAVFGSLETVAIFDVALRSAALVTYTLDAINSAIGPYISKEYQKNDLKKLQQIVTKTCRVIFVFAVPIVLIFILGGKTLLTKLFGEEYSVAYIPLIILCIGQLINASTGSVGLILNMTGNQKYVTKITFYITLFNLILSIPIVIHYNILGAALLFSFLLIIQNVIFVIYTKKKLNINSTIF